MSKTAQQPKFLVETSGLDLESSDPADLLGDRRNKYLLVNVLARRARELNRGERSLVDLSQPHTYTELAVAESGAHKLKLVRKQKSKVLVNLIKND